MSNEVAIPTGAAVLGMVGAWAEDTEIFLTNKLSTDRAKITLSRSEAENVVEALKQVQEGLVVVLNGDADLHNCEEGEVYIDPSVFMQACSGIDHLQYRFYQHLQDCSIAGKKRGLTLSTLEVKGFLSIVDACKTVLCAMDGGDGGHNPGGGHVLEDVWRVEGNVIYPDVWHRQAA